MRLALRLLGAAWLVTIIVSYADISYRAIRLIAAHDVGLAIVTGMLLLISTACVVTWNTWLVQRIVQWAGPLRIRISIEC